MGYVGDGNESAKAVKLLKQFIGGDFRIQLDTYLGFDLVFVLREYNKDIAGFSLVQQINCCGILVSTRTWVNEDWRGQGIAQSMMPLKEALAKEFGYGMLLATVNMSGNLAEVHILEKCGWKLGDSFTNPRTRNEVGVYTKDLKIED